MVILCISPVCARYLVIRVRTDSAMDRLLYDWSGPAGNGNTVCLVSGTDGGLLRNSGEYGVSCRQENKEQYCRSPVKRRIARKAIHHP